MLTKAATHIRPLLRLQQHATHQPDLFTSNPSLLHHFQGQSVGNTTIVAAQSAQAASGSSGAAGGAGRSGYSGASNGGGYTGHARAFLTFQQGPGADASSIATSSDDKEVNAARQRAHLQLKQRIASRRDDSVPVRTVMVRDKLAARAGSRPVALVEMEQQQPEEPMSPKRSTIAYPAWAALPADAAAGGALWLPGAAPRQIGGARAFSTRTRPTANAQVTAAPTPEQSRIDQPNRVLMDLAGLDIGRPVSPTTSARQVRRNSTDSTTSRPDFLPRAKEMDADEQVDRDFYSALTGARYAGKKELSLALVEHYRSPRGQASLSEPNAALVQQHQLPQGYSTQVYNNCLETLLVFRGRGESIAPVLDTYNEMLHRDVLPNSRTTQLVIRALCLRDEDVSAASLRWARRREWIDFKRDQLHIEATESPENENAAAAITAYQSEHNFTSAAKLFKAAGLKTEAMLADLLSAARASMGLPYAPTVEQLKPLFTHHNLHKESLDIYADVFEILSNGGGAEVIRMYWNKFTEALKNAAMTHDLTKETSAIMDGHIAAIRAFVSIGDMNKAKEIVGLGAHNARYLGAFVAAAAKHGDLDAALASYNSKTDRIPIESLFILAEELAAAGRFDSMVECLRNMVDNLALERPGFNVDRNQILKIHGIVLAQAVNAESVEARDAAITAATNLYAVAMPTLDPSVLRLHVDLLLASERFADIPAILRRQTARAGEESNLSLRSILLSTAASAAPIATVLDTVRGLARLGERISEPTDPVPIGALIVDKYRATRASASVVDLHLTHDQWFRLVEAFNALPQEYLDAVPDGLEAFLADLQVVQKGRFPLPGSFVNAPASAELADLLIATYGAERASELLTGTFGPKASVLLPTPEASVASSEPSFTLPPTPTSSHSPPSEHALQISAAIDQAIDRLAAPGMTPLPARVYDVVRAGVAEKKVPSPESLGRLMTALARAGDEPKVRELYSLAQVILASCIPDQRNQAEGWRTVEDCMIASCCYLGHLEQAGMHRARIIEAGMAPSADAYATMIACSRDSTDDALVARELFDESQALGVVPHLYLFNTIISKLSKARKAEMALELFTHMKNAGIRPSSVTYGAVINACCRVGDAESAAVLFEEMSSQPNFKPRVPPFNTMMQFHLQTRPSRERVLYYYDAMTKAGVRPSAHTYKLLLDAYGTLPTIDLPAMEGLFAKLAADRHVPVQGTHWASLITAYGLHSGDVDKALEVFSSITAHPSTARNNASPEPVVWEAVLNVLGQRGTLEQIDAIVAQMRASGARSTAYVCNVLIAGYARHGQFDRAREMFEGMADSVTGVAAPNNHPALLTSSGHAKPSATTTEPTDVVYREPSTYEAMVRAEMRAGNRPGAEAVLRRMEERRYPVAVWMKVRQVIEDTV